jgi:hypothetical protein
MNAFRSELAGHRSRDEELDRLRLQSFVAELEDEVGPVDETEVARYSIMLGAAPGQLKRSSAAPRVAR